METKIELTGLMQDDQLDAVVGGCNTYAASSYYYEEKKDSGRSGGRSLAVDAEINVINVDDINITADDGAKVFVTFVQDN